LHDIFLLQQLRTTETKAKLLPIITIDCMGLTSISYGNDQVAVKFLRAGDWNVEAALQVLRWIV
jgi:hypothetical protein